MVDFMTVATRTTRSGIIEIYPKFIVKKSKDLMIRGGDFYAVYLEDTGMWSTDEFNAIQLIDSLLDTYAEEKFPEGGAPHRVLHMWDSESRMIDSWHKYCQRDMRDNFKMLDEKITFSNTEVKKEDYASKRLNYPLSPGPIDAFDKLIGTLYEDSERHKIEWAIGSIVCGDSKSIQKFMVLYGAHGTGKSTILNIIATLFAPYTEVFDAKALGSSNSTFALEPFVSNPLVAIQHDGDLSRIEDNTRLNSLISHESMRVNEKFKRTYTSNFKTLLFIGSNKPVKITDAKSGLLRRLIDVSPSGNTLPRAEYNRILKQIPFELGAIAYHCAEVYQDDPSYYDDYQPRDMMEITNDFYNFVEEYYMEFKREDGTSLKAAWDKYKVYCEETKTLYPMSQRVFKEELKSYFCDYKDRYVDEEGNRIRKYYFGFKSAIFDGEDKTIIEKTDVKVDSLELTETVSLLDDICKDCKAQYAVESGSPAKKWDNVSTKLSDLDSRKLHYVKLPENHIVIDFDLTDEDGNKSLERNLQEAAKWPKTYAELSKSGTGVHLHYYYNGDASKLSRVHEEHIEVKVFTGNSSLRRMLTLCNAVAIATISSGLALKEDAKMVDFKGIQNEKALRTIIIRNLKKEYHQYTKPSIDFIYKVLQEAYDNGVPYDVSDMRNAIFAFAANSSNQSDYCMKLVNSMPFKSKDIVDNQEFGDSSSIIFFDVEVFPNLFVVDWKVQGKKSVVRMINPGPKEIEDLMRFKLVGFNNRRYDNHILYGCYLGLNNEQLYKLSQQIINEDTGFYGEAYNLSYTDIYDYSAKKQSLKKWEIELGIHHQELGLPWDQPVPENMWIKVAEYCENDVLATEAVFEATKGDFAARGILAELAGMTVNDTTNSLTQRIIFGTNRNPQSVFNYRDMGKVEGRVLHSVLSPKTGIMYNEIGDPEYTVFDLDQRPIFPGYKYENGISTYREEEIGEGGYVYAEPGIYYNVALLDVESMHPHSAIAENLFGEYTKRFNDILQARLAIKHKRYDEAKTMMNGALAKYLNDVSLAKNLSQALKIAINSVYGLTAAKFANAFRDPRNKDNIVAKRGALFMVNLKHEVQARGFTVAHIKTDSIKIPNATPEIIQFCIDYADMYGYTFEHEATYERMCLVNDAVYIARYLNDDGTPGEWTATGTQFQIPYVFKTLFSKEPITFGDLCVTNSVTTAIYLDFNAKLPDVSLAEKEKKKVITKLDNLFPDSSEYKEYRKRLEDLNKEIEQGHNYHFVGKVSSFCPITTEGNGAVLVAERKNKLDEKSYAAVTGSSGYRWLEAEMVKELEKEPYIDMRYFNTLVDDAVDAINKYGDFEQFVA